MTLASPANDAATLSTCATRVPVRPETAAEAHVAILTQQVSHYHAARYRAAMDVFGRVSVVSVVNAAEFQEFLAAPPRVGEPAPVVAAVCDGAEDYEAAIAGGTLWRRVAGTLDALAPDVVAVAGWSFSESLSAIAWARANGRPAVMMSASQARDGVRTGWREGIKSRIVGACDAALVAAERHAAYAVALGLPETRVFTGYDAVDNAHFALGADAARADPVATRAAEGLPPRYLLASGRFVAKKNFPGLVTAFAAALATGDRGHHLVILGDGPEREAVGAAADRAGVAGRVGLPGFRSYDRLPAIYALADGFAHVSLAEQWGLVVNEAAAAGLPLVVSAPCGAATLVRPGHNGFVVDPSDGASVAAALRTLMDLDPAERTRMGAASRRIVAGWGPERFASGLAAACEAALEMPARRLGALDAVLLRAVARLRIARTS